MQVLYSIARSISELHAAGFVHGDIQPCNVIWLPRENRWSVIGFRRTVRVGERVPLRYNPTYAAPEVIQAYLDGQRHMEATPALDAWSLGVLALELFTGKAAFDSSLCNHAVRTSSPGSSSSKALNAA
jgi:eukaryotic-like serine/threonine-protein kinase